MHGSIANRHANQNPLESATKEQVSAPQKQDIYQQGLYACARHIPNLSAKHQQPILRFLGTFGRGRCPANPPIGDIL
jgi:hypothetical protein